MLRKLPALLALLLVSQTLPLAAYGGGDGGSGAALSNAVTQKVVTVLTQGVQGCQKLDKVYRYDCYRQVYAQAARRLQRRPAYAPAREVLLEVEQRLARTVTRNLDPAAPQARAGLQRYRAIKASALPRAKADFVRALEQGETKLLRSRDKGHEHFVKIAQALNTNKVLLRSAWLRLLGRPDAA